MSETREQLILNANEGRLIISGDHKNFEVIEDRISGTGRWSIHHSVVVKRNSDGKFFESEYSEGATESQDERPYEWSNAEFNEVFEKTKTITVYE